MHFFKNVTLFWSETWHQSPLLFFLELIGAVSSISGGLALVMLIEPNMIIVFSLYLFGSIPMFWASWMRRSAWMMCVFGTFTIMNIIGLLNHILY